MSFGSKGATAGSPWLGGLSGLDGVGVFFRLGLGPLSALGSEGPDDLVACLDIRAADQVDAVGHGRKDPVDNRLAVLVLQAFERFRNGLGLTGKIDDEGRVIGRLAQNGRLTGKNGGRNKVAGNRAHLLAETGHLPRAHGQRGLGRNVAARRTRAAVVRTRSHPTMSTSSRSVFSISKRSSGMRRLWTAKGLTMAFLHQASSSGMPRSS